MLPAVSVQTSTGRTAEIRFTECADGDLTIGVDPAVVVARRRSIVDAPWNWVCQVHGSTVLEAGGPGSCVGLEADGLVTGELGSPLAVLVADCAPVVLVGASRIGVMHAGWRGLLDGVVEHGVEALGEDPRGVQAHLGPVIRPRHYEFGTEDLAAITAEFGPAVCGRTDWGSSALDVPALLAESLRRAGVVDLVDHGYDTADQQFFSHRLRADAGRHAAVAWLRAA